MCKILPRIKAFAEAQGITIGALEKQIGASKGVISRAINNGTDIQAKWLEALVANYPQCSPTWLLKGEGPMIIIEAEVDASINNSSEDTLPLVSIIQSQAEEIGKLKERIRQMERGETNNNPKATSKPMGYGGGFHSQGIPFPITGGDLIAAEP